MKLYKSLKRMKTPWNFNYVYPFLVNDHSLFCFTYRRYMAEILRKTLSNQSINQSIFSFTFGSFGCRCKVFHCFSLRFKYCHFRFVPFCLLWNVTSIAFLFVYFNLLHNDLMFRYNEKINSLKQNNLFRYNRNEYILFIQHEPIRLSYR